MFEGLQSFFGKEVIFFIDKSLWVTFCIGLQVIHDFSNFGVKEFTEIFHQLTQWCDGG